MTGWQVSRNVVDTAGQQYWTTGPLPDSEPIVIPHGFYMGHSGSMGFAWVQVNPFKSHLGPIRARPLLTHGEVKRTMPTVNGFFGAKPMRNP